MYLLDTNIFRELRLLPKGKASKCCRVGAIHSNQSIFYQCGGRNGN